MGSRWLEPSEARIGLGCMRLQSAEPIAAAVTAGITIFDTARTYGFGDNEKLLARALRACGAAATARIVTKGGMARTEDRWIPDGRGKTILSDCEASLRALDGLPIDLYLIHAPDPRTPWATSLRALERIRTQGMARHVGVSNVNLRQLEQAMEHAEISAVEVAINPFDDHAVRGGLVRRCEEKQIAVIAHSPFGGPRRAGRLSRIEPLLRVAQQKGATPAEVALAWLLDLSPSVVAIPGARRSEAVVSAVRATTILLTATERASLPGGFGGHAIRHAARSQSAIRAEVVMVMGIPGSGKSRMARDLAGRGYLRLNRDDRGGSLGELAATLDAALAGGAARVVLDNTYLTRASRNRVLETAERHGASVKCLWLETPLDQAQVNVVERLLDRFGSLPSPEMLRERSRAEPGLHTPTSQMRTLRELEPPSIDEGFAEVERIAFSRAAASDRSRSAVFVAAEVMSRQGWQHAIAGNDPGAPHLVFDWCSADRIEEVNRSAAQLSSLASGPVEVSVCPHGGGPPICWCRPPLPGLPMAFARAHGVDLRGSTVIGTSTAHRKLAATLGARYVEVG